MRPNSESMSEGQGMPGSGVPWGHSGTCLQHSSSPQTDVQLAQEKENVGPAGGKSDRRV